MCCDHAALRCVPCNEARQHVEEVDVARGRPMTFIWPKPRLCALCLEASSIGRSLEASSRPRIAAKCMHSFRRLHSFPRNLGTKTSADWGRGVEEATRPQETLPGEEEWKRRTRATHGGSGRCHAKKGDRPVDLGRWARPEVQRGCHNSFGSRWKCTEVECTGGASRL